MVRELSPDMIVIDPLANLAEGLVDDARASDDWVPVMKRLGLIAHQMDSGILILHHGRRSDGQYRDSSAIGAGVDMIVHMGTPSREPNGDIREFEPKGRWAVSRFALRFDGDQYVLLGKNPSLEERVVRVVTANPGIGKSEVRQKVTGKAVQIDEAITKLLEEGLIEDRKSGNAHRYYVTSESNDGGTGVGQDKGQVRSVPRSNPKLSRRTEHNKSPDEDGEGVFTITIPEVMWRPRPTEHAHR
jgi:hypothetical protein